MRRVLPVLLFIIFAGPLSAQPPARTHDIKPRDYFNLATPLEVSVSPDGKHAAYAVATWDKNADNRRTDLWIVATDGKSPPKKLTTDRANDRQIRWDAAGKTLFFLGNRRKDGQKEAPFNGTTQVWSVAADGGDVRAVTKVSGGITGYDLAAKVGAVFYTVEVEAIDEDQFTKLRNKFSKLDYGHGSRKVSQLMRMDIEGGARGQQVAAENRNIRDLAVTSDGTRVAMITTPDDTVITSEGRSRVDVWDAASNKVTTTDESWRKTAASPWPWLESVTISPDGKHVAYCTVFDAYPAEIIICASQGESWPATRMKRPDGVHVRGYGTPLRWNDSSTLTYLAEKWAQVYPIAVNIETGKTSTSQALAGKVVVASSGSGKTSVAITGMPGEFLSLYVLENGSDQAALITDLNPDTKTWKLPTVQHVTWKAPDGTTVGGVLELPFGYKKGTEKLPLVIGIHGGPTTANYASTNYDIWEGRTYLPAAGYAVLCPNYRGSTGYGDKFVTDLIGNENDIEVRDILAGIKFMIDEGIADPDRIAVMGWSNGGYLTNCLITLKDPPFKFKAAISGAGILDTVAEWGFNDEPAYPTVFKKGFPWETPDIYRNTSPTYGLGNVKTPTLIHVGGNDERCPPGHSRMLYRALKEYVKVPTELIVYPGEPHGLTKFTNRQAKMEWDLAWLEKYMPAHAK